MPIDINNRSFNALLGCTLKIRLRGCCSQWRQGTVYHLRLKSLDLTLKN